MIQIKNQMGVNKMEATLIFFGVVVVLMLLGVIIGLVYAFKYMNKKKVN